MIGTYAAALAVCGASLAIGQAAIGLCGVRRWSWLSPAVGLALLTALCWATVRLPGDGAVSAIAVFVATAASIVYLWGRAEGMGETLVAGAPVALIALAVSSLPFVVEGHFGILGTGFNPDMSQHLLATDRLAAGESSELLNQGYPLGPHAIVVALHKGLGIGLVQGFSGLTMAVAILAPLTALTAFADQPAFRRTAAALVVGLPYLVASYYAQGSFKETIQALYVLAFVLALRDFSSPEWGRSRLRFIPAALIAIGSVYTYSFAGLTWLAGIAAVWAIVELARARHVAPAGGVGGGGAEDAPARGAPSPPTTGPVGLRAMSLAILVFAIAALPELGRMIDFQQFETFDPSGPGLGNLFGQLSPFTALGIWFSGDFRVALTDGSVPAFAYLVGASFASVLFLYGLAKSCRQRELAVLAGVLVVAGIYLAARLGGTPYTAAKALEIAAPLAALAIVLPLVKRPVVLLYLAAAGFCSLLAFANAPVGPTSYSPALTELRPAIAADSTLVLAPQALLADEQGARYIAWELRGGRVCILVEGEADAPPPGVRFVVTWDGGGRPPFPGLRLRRDAGPYLLWERRGSAAGRSPCPLIAVRQARQGPPR